MPKPSKGPRLGSGPAHERLMLANLSASLFEHRRIKTTLTKARRLRPVAERMVAYAKRGDLHARRRVFALLHNKPVLHELFENIAPQVQNRPGGFTRIIKIGNRKGDNAPMAMIELVLDEIESVPARPGPAEDAVEEHGPESSPDRAPSQTSDLVGEDAQKKD